MGVLALQMANQGVKIWSARSVLARSNRIMVKSDDKLTIPVKSIHCDNRRFILASLRK